MPAIENIQEIFNILGLNMKFLRIQIILISLNNQMHSSVWRKLGKHKQRMLTHNLWCQTFYINAWSLIESLTLEFEGARMQIVNVTPELAEFCYLVNMRTVVVVTLYSCL